MTEEPTPRDYAKFYAGLAGDLAVARRLIATLHAQQPQDAQAIIDEIILSGRMGDTLFATCIQALEFLALLLPDPERRQRFVDALAFEGVDSAQAAREFLRDIDGG